MAIVTFEPPKTPASWLFPAALIAASAAAAWQASNFTGLAFKPFSGEEIVGNLTALFLISAFLERALEVFVSSWRDAARRALEQDVLHAAADVKATADAAAAAEAQRQLREHRRALHLFKAKTARVTFACGLIAGAVIALAGARALGPLLVQLPPAGSPQALVVTIVDVVMTAGLIGGGSDGIHKLVSVITDYLDAVRGKVAGK
jgi:hypothetical protein